MRYYLVEKWDDKSAAWIKVKMFSLHTQTPVAHVSEICVANFRDRLTGKFCTCSVLFKFSNKDSYLWCDTRRAYLLYLSLYRVNVVYSRSRVFRSMIAAASPHPLWPFYFYISLAPPRNRTDNEEKAPYQRGNEQIPAKFRQLRNPRTCP